MQRRSAGSGQAGGLDQIPGRPLAGLSIKCYHEACSVSASPPAAVNGIGKSRGSEAREGANARCPRPTNKLPRLPAATAPRSTTSNAMVTWEHGWRIRNQATVLPLKHKFFKLQTLWTICSTIVAVFLKTCSLVLCGNHGQSVSIREFLAALLDL